MFKNGKPPKDWNARQEELTRLPKSAQETLRHLDNEFYKYDEDITKLLYEFVVKHHSEFLDA